MTDITEEIKEVLEQSPEETGFEETIHEGDSPLNQPVKEKDIAGSTSTPDPSQQSEPGSDTSNEPLQDQPPEDAPEQTIDENYQPDGDSTDGAEFELPTSFAKQAAESVIGSVNNILEVTAGSFVRIEKHDSFYEFPEIIELIDEMNEQNVECIKFDEQDKALMMPLMIQIAKKRALNLTPEQQFVGVLISILAKNTREAIKVRKENQVWKELVLEKVEKAIEKQNRQDHKPENDSPAIFSSLEEQEPELDLDDTSVLEVAEDDDR